MKKSDLTPGMTVTTRKGWKYFVFGSPDRKPIGLNLYRKGGYQLLNSYNDDLVHQPELGGIHPELDIVEVRGIQSNSPNFLEGMFDGPVLWTREDDELLAPFDDRPSFKVIDGQTTYYLDWFGNIMHIEGQERASAQDSIFAFDIDEYIKTYPEEETGLYEIEYDDLGCFYHNHPLNMSYGPPSPRHRIEKQARLKYEDLKVRNGAYVTDGPQVVDMLHGALRGLVSYTLRVGVDHDSCKPLTRAEIALKTYELLNE